MTGESNRNGAYLRLTPFRSAIRPSFKTSDGQYQYRLPFMFPVSGHLTGLPLCFLSFTV